MLGPRSYRQSPEQQFAVRMHVDALGVRIKSQSCSALGQHIVRNEKFQLEMEILKASALQFLLQEKISQKDTMYSEV